MNAQQQTLAQNCLDAAENNTKAFSEIVGVLIGGGFESYTVDYRRATTTYYLPTGESVELAAHRIDQAVGEVFDTTALAGAIREAQILAAGYTYKGFSAKAKVAGCVGYMVSFMGRRAVYFGRTGETHVELFPSAS
jgi:uncharacterized protein YbcV (DUF1398 family)